MHSLRWRSPPTTPTVSEAELNEIAVPHTGLYGIFLGSDCQRDKFEVPLKKNEKNSFPTHCGCLFEACFSRSGAKCIEEKKLDFRCPLPFSSNPKNPLAPQDANAKILSTSRVARIVWLRENTKVSVKHIHGCYNDKRKCCNGDSNWEWGLVFHMLAGSESIIDENVQQATQQGSNIFYSFHARQIQKKSFLCTECSRKFANPRAVYSHYLTAHATVQDSSELIGPPILRKPLQVTYEDDDLVIVVKPQRIAVQGERWTLSKSDLFLPFCAPRDREGGLSKPRIAHRLDAATGGLLVVAKMTQSEIRLKENFANRYCKKRYRAIVFGRLEPNSTSCVVEDFDHDEEKEDTEYCGIINSPVANKAALTRYSIVCHSRSPYPQANGWMTTVDLFPVTGRKHQLRRHLKSIGHPIWGDQKHGPYPKVDVDCQDGVKRDIDSSAPDYDEDVNVNARDCPHHHLCLWALEISFPHPSKDEMVLSQIDEPPWYSELRCGQEEQWKTNSTNGTN